MRTIGCASPLPPVSAGISPSSSPRTASRGGGDLRRSALPASYFDPTSSVNSTAPGIDVEGWWFCQMPAAVVPLDAAEEQLVDGARDRRRGQPQFRESPARLSCALRRRFVPLRQSRPRWTSLAPKSPSSTCCLPSRFTSSTTSSPPTTPTRLNGRNTVRIGRGSGSGRSSDWRCSSRRSPIRDQDGRATSRSYQVRISVLRR